MKSLDKSKFDAAFARASAEVPLEPAVGEKDPRVQELWALIEPRLEQESAFQHEIRELFAESRNEIRSWRNGRRIATGFALLVIVVVLVGATVILLNGSLHAAALGEGDAVQIAFIAGAFGAIITLTAIILRGAFTPHVKDEKGLILPEQIKPVLDAAMSAIDGKH